MKKLALTAVVLWMLPAALGAQSPPLQNSVSIFNGKDLTGWRVEGADATVANGVIGLRGEKRGWIRTEAIFGDFLLNVKFRLLERDTKAGVFVRTWPTVGKEPALSPTNGYRAEITDATAGAVPLGRVLLHGVKGVEEYFGADVVPAIFKGVGEWHSLAIQCIGDTLLVSVDGRAISRSSGVENPQGHVALRLVQGAIEFTEIWVRRFPPPIPPAAGAVPVGGDVLPPRLVRDVKPSYTANAMRAKIQGEVLLQAVVQPDGRVGDVRILRSLDPKHGLDDQAVRTVRQWEFQPGTRQGEPVPVAVTVAIAFTLK